MTKKHSGGRRASGNSSPSASMSPVLRINTNLSSPSVTAAADDTTNAAMLPPPLVLSASAAMVGNRRSNTSNNSGAQPHAQSSPFVRRTSTNSPRLHFPRQQQSSGRGLARSGSFSSGTSSLSSSPMSVHGNNNNNNSNSSAAPHAASLYPVHIALLSKNMRTRVDFRGGVKGEVFRLGEIYLNDLSDIRVLELTNVTPRRVQLQLKLELRKPFQTSGWGFQLENENVALLASHARDVVMTDEFNHVPFSVLRSSSKAALCAENVYLCEGYNELFNQIGTIDELTLAPHETTRVVLALCAKLSSQSSSASHAAAAAAYSLTADSSEEERMHLHQTSCAVLTGRVVMKFRYMDAAPSPTSSRPLSPAAAAAATGGLVSVPDLVLPVQGQVCRSLLRLDVKELHFDDCVPGGSFVKDFTVWNRSEIPLLFKLVSSLATFEATKNLITCSDYNSGYVVGDKTLQAAAYGHVRIRVTYRPDEIGERFFEIQAQNLHDARNVKILKVQAITNKEHHREGLSIKEPSGSYLMSGSKLDFGDCYTGIANSKVLLVRNTTEATLHVDLTSDRPKEISFELKLQQNRARASRAPRGDEMLSPTGSNDGSSRRGSLSPDAAKAAAMAFANGDSMNSYGLDSDDEAEENEMDFFEDEFLPGKHPSFDENPLGDLDDVDDDFEFDREPPRVAARSPSVSPNSRVSRRASETRKKSFRTKAKTSTKALSRVRDLSYESGVESSGNSICSSPERKPRFDVRRRQSTSLDDTSGSNFLVETIDLPPGVERTILIWYTPATMASTESLFTDTLDGIDLKGARLTKQTFRVSFRCFQTQGAWQQAQARVYDRTLGKSIHIRARTCTSIVTVSPSILHLGDCNIGELKSSSCMLTNHSELPTVVKPLVTSKVISTVPNDELTLGPKQSTELKIEIIPRKTNPNYSRLISVLNLKNRTNVPQICVRSSNMDAHHVIYHSLFYKLLTQSRSAFLNFDHIPLNAFGIQVFDLENITNAPLHLNLQSSDPTKVRLYCFKTVGGSDKHGAGGRGGAASAAIGGNDAGKQHAGAPSLHASQSLSDKFSAATGFATSATNAAHSRPPQPAKLIRRRRSFGSLSEIASAPSASKRNMSSVLRGYLSKKLLASGVAQSAHHAGGGGGGGGGSSGASATSSVAAMTPTQSLLEPAKRSEQLASHHSSHHLHAQASAPATPHHHHHHHPSTSHEPPTMTFGGAASSSTSSSAAGAAAKPPVAEELAALLHMFDKSRTECEQYCHSTLPSVEKEQEIVAMVRERMRKLQSLLADKKLLPLPHNNKDRNLRIPAKSQQRIVAIFSPSAPDDGLSSETASKVRVEKHKIFITLPAGGNKKAVADAARFDQIQSTWVTSKHPFDMRPSVRELLLKSRVCRSVMNVNQKNINFGRIATSSKSSKRLVVQNMSPIPLVYSVEKTGSISSGFLEIKEGDVGVVKAFGTKEICFEFQPTLAGPFEEKLRIVNVQDVENSISVTIKAKVVKRETFKLLQSGQVLSLGKCLVGEQSDTIKIAVRNMSRKKRDYMIQLDPSFSNPALKPTFYFSIDETPSAIITQAQEKKLDEELEKLEHKLRIATTKKKSDKITKLNTKIARAKALLSGEQVPVETKKKKRAGSGAASLTTALDDELKAAVTPAAAAAAAAEVYDSESEMSESESTSQQRRRPTLQLAKSLSLSDTRGNVNQLHFSLDAEATCRIVAYAVFTSTQLDVKGGELLAAGRFTSFKSQKARKRQLRRDSTPIIGVGKFLLFEQQNKDIMKELQYSAEIFLRTDAGEAAYSRAVGRSLLPSHRASLGTASASGDASADAAGKEPVLSLQALLAKSDSSRGLTIAVPESDRAIVESSKVLVRVEPNQFAISHSSTLLIPLEETPADTYGWEVTLSHASPSVKRTTDVDVTWRPSEALQRLLQISCDVTPADAVLVCADNNDTTTATATEQPGSDITPESNRLPLRVRLTSDRSLTLHFKWCFASTTGFAASNSLASCISRSVLAKISKALEQNAGKLEFSFCSNASSSAASSPLSSSSSAAAHQSAATSTPFASVDVAVVKAVQRSLCVDMDKIELGEQQQGTEVCGEFIIRNRSHRQVKYLLLVPSARESSNSASVSANSGSGSSSSTQSSSASASSAQPTTPSSSSSSGGELMFEKPTGSIAANSHVVARFTYRGTTPGQHSEQLQLRNLNDRLDTSILTLAVRVTRPVYVRVPELDPHATGRLDVLDLGPCYVTPEMQDVTADSPNVSLKFSKVHKLTLHNQVDETLVLCASSNLKTQCYVYEDPRLNREATHVVLRGKQSIDLFAAFRPRLSSDAFKTGSTRDLVGGIRMQLFRLVAPAAAPAAVSAAAEATETPASALTSTDEPEKSEMVAEFTIKFVGVAGASLARVSPTTIDFGVERNLGGRETPQAHAGSFEVINVSKALPLRYRLFVASDSESYSDDDSSLHVALAHEQGDVPAGETKSVAFTLTAFASGFFRRRILIENVHYPGKISTIDVLLFVDSGALQCEVFGSLPRDVISAAITAAPTAATMSSSKLATHAHAIDFGVVHVIKLENELSDAPVHTLSGTEAEPTSRKYRIFETRHVETPTAAAMLTSGAVVGHALEASSSLSPTLRKPLPHERFLTLTNTTDSEMVLRPVSTLPLSFVWCRCGIMPPQAHECPHRAELLTARTTSVDRARQLHVDAATTLSTASASLATSFAYGDVYRMPPQSSCVLFFRFAPISLTAPLPSDLIEHGKFVPFTGAVAIQRFLTAGDTNDVVAESSCDALAVVSTLTVVRLSGEFGESRIVVSEKHVSLGKIGYAIGWTSSRFELTVTNTSDADVCMALAHLPPGIRIRDVRGAMPTAISSDGAFAATAPSATSSHDIPSLRELVLHAERKVVKGDDDRSASHTWKIDAHATCVLEMEFFRTAESLPAGVHDFSLRFLNLYNPHNVEDVIVRAHIISSYAELTINPESSIVGAESEPHDLLLPRHVAFLPPVVVPPAQDALPKGANFWFSLRNVYDEDLSVKLSSTPHSALESTLEFLLFSRSANTPVSTLLIAPGDSVDVRVVCHVFSSARLSPDTLMSTELDATHDISELGSVWLDVSVPSAPETAQTKHINVKGRLVPGKTFTLSASSLHFFAGATELPTDIPVELLPTSLRSKIGGSRESTQLALTGATQAASSSTVHHLRTTAETFYVRNPSTLQPLNFMIESVAMYQPGLCLLKGASASEMSALSEYIEAVVVPSSGTIAPGESMKITVRLEEATLVAAAEAAHYHGNGDNTKAASLLHKVRHHPSWRSNSWGTETPDAVAETEAQNHMLLKIRDVDMSTGLGVTTEIDVHLVLQQTATTAADGSVKPTSSSSSSVDSDLVRAAFAAREKRLVTTKKAFVAPTLATHVEDADREDDSEYTGVDNLDEFDLDSISNEPSDRRSQLPVLTVRGCTPAENSSLESTRYIVDVGQHTVRNGGEVEWEITVECLYTQLATQESSSLEPVEYKLVLVNRNAKSWLQLSRDRGTLDRSRSYQSVVLYFLRDVVGVYSTFMVLQNVTNPSDLKVIHVRLEVIADLNMLRSMSAGVDPATNLFRVLVSNHGAPKRQRRSSLEFTHGNESESPRGGGSSNGGTSGTSNTSTGSGTTGSSTASRAGGLVIDYSEVYYHKLYHNHSIVLENSSGLTLDFMLSSNARPQEVSFSTSATSFTEVSAVTLEAHGRMQVFLHFRPLPRSEPAAASTASTTAVAGDTTNSSNSSQAKDGGVDHWVREIEVYINCRLVKDFRETVTLRAICNQPQLQVNVAQSKTDDILARTSAQTAATSATATPTVAASAFVASQPSFLGAVFSMPESALANSEVVASTTTTAAALDADKFIVVHNTRSDMKARLALRNDSMFFSIGVDVLLTAPGSVDVHYLDSGICAGRRATLLVTIQPRAAVVFRVTPDTAALWKHHQLWDHSVKEHVTLYNIKQFAEHYQVTLCFTCSSVSNFYIPPNVSESYPFSALEDTIAKFLQNYNYTWRGLVRYHEAQTATVVAAKSSSSTAAAATATLTASKLLEILSALESALEQSSPLSPRKPPPPTMPRDFEPSSPRRFDGFASSSSTSSSSSMSEHRDPIHQLVQSYRALYFDFYYITDELVWYGVRGNAVRHSLMLADLAYGVVFGHDVFRAFVAPTDATAATTTSSASSSSSMDAPAFPRMLLPWIRQLGHFLSFFPESQDTPMPLRQLYDQLRKFEVV